MCGIAGYYAKKGVVDNDQLEALGIIMGRRGMDSTGFMAITSNGRFAMKKSILDVRSFFKAEHLPNNLKWCVIHTRGASCGKITPGNAHPFMVGKICGMQNGFMPNHDKIAKALKLPSRQVDSHTLIDVIVSKSLGDPLDKQFNELWLGAVVWWDGEKLHLRDNSHYRGWGYSNLWMYEDDDRIVFASTPMAVAHVIDVDIDSIRPIFRMDIQ